MKLLTYDYRGLGPRAGVLEGDTVVDITTLLGCHRVIEDISDLLRAFNGADITDMLAQALKNNTAFSVPLQEVTLCAPLLRPTTIRDCAIFEKHVAAASRRNHTTIPDSWYEKARFYFSNTSVISGPNAAIKGPANTTTLDYEAELCFIIGKSGENVSQEDAMGHLFGLCVFNDWSNRALCLDEVGFLGMHKSKDFANGFGPWVVTADEFPEMLSGGKVDLKVDVWVNGVQTTDSSTGDMYWTFPQLIERISKDSRIAAGDIIGLGTVGGGSLFDQDSDKTRYLQPGDEVKVSIERVGELTQFIAK